MHLALPACSILFTLLANAALSPPRAAAPSNFDPATIRAPVVVLSRDGGIPDTRSHLHKRTGSSGSSQKPSTELTSGQRKAALKNIINHPEVHGPAKVFVAQRALLEQQAHGFWKSNDLVRTRERLQEWFDLESPYPELASQDDMDAARGSVARYTDPHISPPSLYVVRGKVTEWGFRARVKFEE